MVKARWCADVDAQRAPSATTVSAPVVLPRPGHWPPDLQDTLVDEVVPA